MGSNPTLSASKSEPQRNGQDLQQKSTQSAANRAFAGFEPDQRNCRTPLDGQNCPRVSLVGQSTVRFGGNGLVTARRKLDTPSFRTADSHCHQDSATRELPSRPSNESPD